MQRYILTSVLVLSFFLPTKCSFLATSEACAMKGLSYGGRMSLIDAGGLGYGSAPPWANKRVFVFRMPHSFFKGRHHRSMFEHAGIGQIRIPDNAPCGGESAHQICPSMTHEKSFCLDPSLPCYKTPPTYARFDPLEFSDVTPTSISVMWPAWDQAVDDGYGPIVEYMVQIREHGEEEFIEVSKGKQLSHIFHDLNENTDYEFQVKIIRDHPFGDGRPSDVQTCMTTTSGPPRFVNSEPLEFIDLTSSAVTISWLEWNQRVDSGTGPVTGYKVVYRVHRVNGRKRWQSEVTSGLSVRLTELTEYTTYDIAMKLEYGDGEYTGISDIQTVITTCGDVGDINFEFSSVSMSIGSAKLTIDWSYRIMLEECEVISQHLSIQQLDLDNCQNHSMTGPIEVDIPDTTTRSYAKRRLKANSEYNVTLTLRTETKVIHKSEKIRTDSSRPSGAPTNLHVNIEERRRGTKLVFGWDEPECTMRHGDIIGYEYEFYRAGGKRSGSTTRKQQAFPVLENGEMYSFWVKAATDKGNGRMMASLDGSIIRK